MTNSKRRKRGHRGATQRPGPGSRQPGGVSLADAAGLTPAEVTLLALSGTYPTRSNGRSFLTSSSGSGGTAQGGYLNPGGPFPTLGPYLPSPGAPAPGTPSSPAPSPPSPSPSPSPGGPFPVPRMPDPADGPGRNRL